MKTSLLLSCALVLCLAVSGANAQAATIDALKNHLAESRIEAKVLDKSTLEFQTGFPDGKNYTFMLRIDEKSKFLYLAIVNLAVLKSTDKDFCAKSKKLLNLNYGIALSKLEWDEPSGEVRLSNSFATEKGFKKEDLLFTIQMLLSTAEKLSPSLYEMRTK